MSPKAVSHKLEREATLKWVPLNKMIVNPMAQRELNMVRVRTIAENFDLEQMGNPTVSERDGHFFIIDGHHRVSALKLWFGDGAWEDQSLECWTYQGLTEQQEAEAFLKLNDTLTVSAFSKFRVGVTSGREEEVEINAIVNGAGLQVARSGEGHVSAVSALRKVYRFGNDGPESLARTLNIIKNSFGDEGFTALIISGIGLFCSRYGSDLDDDVAIHRLQQINAGPIGFLNKARALHATTGQQLVSCVAAVAVDTYNRARGKKKLQSWF